MGILTHKSEFVPCRKPTEVTQQSNENTEVPIILDLENQNINPLQRKNKPYNIVFIKHPHGTVYV